VRERYRQHQRENGQHGFAGLSEGRHFVRRARLAVHQHEPERGGAQCDDVEAGAGHNLIVGELRCDEREQRREQGAGENAADRAEPRVSGCARDDDGRERAADHDAFEPDVHDARTLGEHAAQRGKDQRRRLDEREPSDRDQRDDEAVHVVRRDAM
jgi:hypothetical protein